MKRIKTKATVLTVAAWSLWALTGCTKDEKKVEEVVAPAAASEPEAKEIPVLQYKVAMKPTKGFKANGTILLTTGQDGMNMEVDMKNVSPGTHGIHIHEKGDCSAPDASSAGGHFNPISKQHGAPEISDSHAGDLGNVAADKKKKVAFKGLVKPASALKDFDWAQFEGKAVILHANPDDLTSQPVGNAGGRIACGVITKVEAQAAEGQQK